MVTQSIAECLHVLGVHQAIGNVALAPAGHSPAGLQCPRGLFSWDRGQAPGQGPSQMLMLEETCSWEEDRDNLSSPTEIRALLLHS